MGYGVVNEENVYICTGNPLQSDIQSIVDWMLNDSFTDAYKSIFSVLTLGINGTKYSKVDQVKFVEDRDMVCLSMVF